MIFRWFLDDGFQGISNDPRLPEIISEILRAHRRGHHLVIIDRQLAAELQKLQLSRADHALLERLGSEFTQTGGLHKRSSAYVVVRNTMEDIASQQGSEYHVSLGLIAKSRLLEPSVLLVENLGIDGWLFKHVFECVGIRGKLGPVAMDTMHGGGDDIANVLDDILPSKRIVVAIVDSDKNSPVSSESPKIARLNKSFAKKQWLLGAVGSPPCREIENLIPLDVIAQLPTGTGSATNQVLLQICDAEEKNGISSSQCFISYFDFKAGTSSATASKLVLKERSWLEAKIAMAGLDSNAFEVHGYGDRVIHQIKADGRHIASLRTGLNQHKWTGRFFSFFCAFAWFFLASRSVRT